MMRLFSSHKSRLTVFILHSVLMIPTNDLTKWTHEKYSKIASNAVTVQKEALVVDVKKSASPLFYKITPGQTIRGFKVEGEFRGLPRFIDPNKQGLKRSDDYALRLGFVVPGTKKLNSVKRFFAAEWVQRIYSLVPAHIGLDRIEFYNVTQNEKELGVRRTHFVSDLMKETIFAVQKSPGSFRLEHTFSAPLEAVALWISCDGDDTQSEYQVVLSSIQLL